MAVPALVLPGRTEHHVLGLLDLITPPLADQPSSIALARYAKREVMLIPPISCPHLPASASLVALD